MFLLQQRKPGPLATTIFVFNFLFLALGTYTPEGIKNNNNNNPSICKAHIVSKHTESEAQAVAR